MFKSIAQAIADGSIVRPILDNPYREGTKAWKRFEAYQNGRKLEDVIADPRVMHPTRKLQGFYWDVNSTYVEIVAPEPKQEAATKKPSTDSKPIPLTEMNEFFPPDLGSKKPAAKKAAKPAAKKATAKKSKK